MSSRPVHLGIPPQSGQGKIQVLGRLAARHRVTKLLHIHGSSLPSINRARQGGLHPFDGGCAVVVSIGSAVCLHGLAGSRQMTMLAFAYVYNLVHSILDEESHLDGEQQGRICGTFLLMRAARLAFSWRACRKAWTLTIGGLCRPWGQV